MSNIISLGDAQKWAKNWRSKSNNTVFAYLIPREDFVDLLGIPNVVNIRAYAGINPETNEDKLMLVGVDANGLDLINAKAGHYIYDFTTPCPSFCDLKSPLFNLDNK